MCIRDRGGKGRGRYVEAVLAAEQSLGQARFSCLWFSMPGVARMLCAGQELIVYGRMKPYGKKLSMVHPDFEIIREGESLDSVSHTISRSLRTAIPMRPPYTGTMRFK